MDRSPELAHLLLRKASEDSFTLEKLVPDPASPDAIIGFHAQQAVEKSVKAVLANASIRYRRTHDIAELIDLLRGSGLAFPVELEEVRALTDFAVAFRYDDMSDDPDSRLDRAWAVDCVRRIRSWATSCFATG